MTATRARKPATARDTLASTMSESELLMAVVDYLAAKGYLVTHTPDSRRVQGHPGVPDILAVGCKRVIFVEAKTEKGRRRPGQIIWASAIRETKAEYYVWRPSDWLDGTIERIISGHLSVAH